MDWTLYGSHRCVCFFFAITSLAKEWLPGYLIAYHRTYDGPWEMVGPKNEKQRII